MAKNKLSDLRDHLFETLEALKDPESPMELDRARAVCTVAQTLIDSARVEVELVKAIGGSAPGTTKFFDIQEESRELPKIASAPVPLRRLGGS